MEADCLLKPTASIGLAKICDRTEKRRNKSEKHRKPCGDFHSFLISTVLHSLGLLDPRSRVFLLFGSPVGMVQDVIADLLRPFFSNSFL